MSSSPGNSRADFVPEPSASSLTYGRRGGCFVSRRQGLLAALALVALVALAAAFGRYVWAPAPRTTLVVPDNSDAAVDQDADDEGGGERLPRGLLPIKYRLHLWPVLDAPPPGRTNFTFEGRLALTFRVLEDGGLDRVTLHAAETLSVDVDGLLVAEASPAGDALADAWTTFPSAPSSARAARAARHIPPQGPAHSPGPGVFADNSTLGRLSVKAVTYDADVELLEVRTAPRMAQYRDYTVFVHFNGTLGDTLAGFYRSSYFEHENQTKRWLAVTQMQPTHAREAFPCMDEPGLRASFQVSIACADGTSAIANAPSSTVTPISGVPGWRWQHFLESVPMPTYLVAFAVTDFSHIKPSTKRLPRSDAPTPSPDSDEVEVRLWARPSVLEHGRYAVDMTPKILAYYADYFSVPYPLSKMDLLAIPDFDIGGMENWGLVMFREMHLLVDEEADDVVAADRVAETLAHELAHQWFGNLVTPAWWDGLWLNEGFSEYVQFAAVDHVEPSREMSARFQTAILQPALRVDASEASRAIAARMRSEHDIMQAFDSITYDKGACLLRMLHHSVGDAAFRQGVSQYLKTWQHNSTTEARLWEPLTEAVLATPPADPWHQRLPENATVATVMSVWTRTTGYPVVNVTRTNGKIVFTQERFLDRAWERNCTRKFSGPQLWYVPLSFATRSEAAANATALRDSRTRAWLVNRTLELTDPTAETASGTASTTLNSDWVVVNLEQAGFYRVNYDLANWRLLSTQLREDAAPLPAGVRAQLLSDAFSLAYAGQLPYAAALNLTTYLPGREDSPRPWTAALEGLDAVHAALTGHPDLVLLEKYMQQLLEPVWDRIAPEDPRSLPQPSAASTRHENLTHEALLLRAEIASWACKVHVDKCEAWARRAVHHWRLQTDPDTNNTVPALLRPVAYCAAVRVGSPDVWDFMWERYLAARRRPADLANQGVILSALACTSEPARVAHVLARALDDSEIRAQDAGRVWMAAGLEPVARLVAFRYLREHWEDIQHKFGSNSAVSSAVATAATIGLSTEADLMDLDVFRSKHKDTLGAVSRALDSSAAGLRTAMQWRHKYLPAVRQWLQESLQNPHIFLN